MITIHVNGHADIEAQGGATLYALLSERGLTEGPCGGGGRCGKCRVRLLTPCEIKDEERRFFSEDELNEGWRLACMHAAEDGMRVQLPGEEDTPEPLTTGAEAAIHVDGEEGYGIAVDIGTTTVAACLVDRRTGAQPARAACLNSQRAFGQDVITRIGYSMQNEGGLRRMQEAICGDIRTLAEKLCTDAGITPDAVMTYTVAANNVMTHIFTGADPAGLAAYPFTPAYTGARELGAEELGLPAAEGAKVWCLPAVSAYVGGDITAGMLTCNLKSLPGNVLLIDIGTNGEMVLSRGGTMFSCSCAAGPALEGMDIRCGMRAAAGAIEDAELRWDGGEPRWVLKTIGNVPPRGLCGSGLLSVVTELVACGALGENGRLQPDPPVSVVEGKRRCVLDAEHDIILSQQDIRQMQLAKGAILAGVEILLKEAELKSEELDQVLVAGQFGAHLTPQSLVGSGLLPAAFLDKVRYVGNSSLAGAVACMLSADMRANALTGAENVRYLELSAYPAYEKALMSAMKFQAPPPERYSCIGDHRTRREVTEAEEASPEAWHFSPEKLVEAAKAQGADGWLVFPFCTTMLAESLGAKPFLSLEGARISETPYRKPEEIPEAPDFTLPRFKAMGEAMELVRGSDVIFQIDGPMAALGQLIPMGKLFVSLRKSDELLRRAEDWACQSAAWAVGHGAKLLSFADPVATLDMLGEKTFCGLYLPSLRRIIERIQRENPSIPVYVCGKMTQSLLDAGAVRPKLKHYEAKTYGEALRLYCQNPENAMPGHFCVQLLKSPVSTLTLFQWNK